MATPEPTSLAASTGPLALALLLLGATALLMVLSALIERSGPIRLRHWAEEAGGALRDLFGATERFELYRLLLSSLARFLPVALFAVQTAALRRLAVPAAIAWSLALVALVVLVVERFSRRLVSHDPEESLRRLTRLYRLLLWLFLPLIAALTPLLPRASLKREEHEDEASDEEIEAYIAVGTREGILEPEEGELLRGVVDFGDTVVRSVMTPRIDMVCAPLNSSLDELADLFLESRHSRIPLYDSSIDRIAGLLHLRDLLRGLRAAGGDGGEGGAAHALDLAKPVFFVPETKSLGALLKELQEQRQQLAIVVDEYGGTAGLVTVEDLVEEIVGDIVDEEEDMEPEPLQVADGAWVLDGRAHIEELEEIFDVEFDGDVPYETVGGLILSVLGSVPEAGESVEAAGLRFTVEQVQDRRIYGVRVESVAAGEAGEEGGSGSP